MVGIVIVSHSRTLARAAVALAEEMAEPWSTSKLHRTRPVPTPAR
jgi:dihydroxyacetone kinase DhaKLM complex PTS-EIIA-like component DhaM